MINEELEVILNNTAEELLSSRKSPSELDTATLPRKMNVYIHCPSCCRRMAEVLFQGHAACMHCRGVDINGNKVIIKRDEFGGL